MINYDKVADKIFSIIKGYGHDLVMFSDEGSETANPEEARRFFIKEPNYMVTLDDSENTIRFIRNSNVPLDKLESLMKHIKQLSQSHMLKTHISAFGQTVSPKEYAHEVEKKKRRSQNKTGVVETIVGVVGDIVEASLSRLHGSKKTSYQTLESVKVIVRHKSAVDEEKHGARSRAIHSIFLERAGERFRFPHNHLPGARAMARHMYEGGDMNDTVGHHIVEQTGNYIKLREFYRYTKSNKLINENSEDIIKVVKENIDQIRNTLGKLSGAKSYGRVKEEIQNQEESVQEELTDDSMVDMFTVKKFDERIGDILPLVNKLVTEKQNWKAKIEEASKEKFVIYREELSEDELLEFEHPAQQLGYKIKRLSERVQEETSLSRFVARAGNKLVEGEELSDFEKTVVRNVLENLEEVDKPKQEEAGLDVIEDVMESVSKRLERYDDRILFQEATNRERVYVLVNDEDIFNGKPIDLYELRKFLQKELDIIGSALIDNHCPYTGVYETDDLVEVLEMNFEDGAELDVGNQDGDWVNLKFRVS